MKYAVFDTFQTDRLVDFVEAPTPEDAIVRAKRQLRQISPLVRPALPTDKPWVQPKTRHFRVESKSRDYVH